MSRTGTVSFGLALERLLDGPAYNGGQAIVMREEAHLKNWISIVQQTPDKNVSDKAFVKHKLREQLRGYVAVTDSPPIQFVQELMEIYPHAKVICTERDPDDWWRSMEPVIRNAKMPFFRFVFYWLPTLRYFVTCYKAKENGRYRDLYIQDGNKTFVRGTYDYHMRYLKRVVPEEKLHFFSVEDGWEPLCKLLHKPVPDEPFPRANDAAIVESFFKSMVLKGLLIWAQVFYESNPECQSIHFKPPCQSAEAKPPFVIFEPFPCGNHYIQSRHSWSYRIQNFMGVRLGLFPHPSVRPHLIPHDEHRSSRDGLHHCKVSPWT